MQDKPRIHTPNYKACAKRQSMNVKETVMSSKMLKFVNTEKAMTKNAKQKHGNLILMRFMPNLVNKKQKSRQVDALNAVFLFVR